MLMNFLKKLNFGKKIYMDNKTSKELPNSLEEHWMPFTANRDFKESPRLMVKA